MMWIWFDVEHSKPNDGRGSFYQRPSRHGAGRFSAPDQAAKSRAVLEYASSYTITDHGNGQQHDWISCVAEILRETPGYFMG